MYGYLCSPSCLHVILFVCFVLGLIFIHFLLIHFTCFDLVVVLFSFVFFCSALPCFVLGSVFIVALSNFARYLLAVNSFSLRVKYACVTTHPSTTYWIHFSTDCSKVVGMSYRSDFSTQRSSCILV